MGDNVHVRLPHSDKETGRRAGLAGNLRRFLRIIVGRNTDAFDIERFEKTTGHRIRNVSHFEEALTHRSVLTSDAGAVTNERLEFLGDSVLGAVVSEFLFRTYPDWNEGDLTKLRSRLVNRKTLARAARAIGLQEMIIVGEQATNLVATGTDTLMSDVLEAVIGAMFLDRGMESARRFIQAVLFSDPAFLEQAQHDDNYKSTLLEFAQSRGLGAPKYVLLKETGPEHAKIFTVSVALKNSILAEGSGRTKKDAEQESARLSLEAIRAREEFSSFPTENAT